MRFHSVLDVTMAGLKHFWRHCLSVWLLRLYSSHNTMYYGHYVEVHDKVVATPQESCLHVADNLQMSSSSFLQSEIPTNYASLESRQHGFHLEEQGQVPQKKELQDMWLAKFYWLFKIRDGPGCHVSQINVRVFGVVGTHPWEIKNPLASVPKTLQADFWPLRD